MLSTAINSLETSSKGTLYFLQTANTSATTYLQATIYEITIYDGDDVVMHLIPVKRSDNVICFYDTVGEKYVVSKTGSHFVAGPEATQE